MPLFLETHPHKENKIIPITNVTNYLIPTNPIRYYACDFVAI